MIALRPMTRLGWLAVPVGLFLFLAAYQLGLPGIHYDEAKEAGVNAMELLHGTPVTAFRGVTVSVLGADLPVMVQDYIGAVNVYLAMPFLAATGIGVPNLRLLSILLAVLGLLALERALSEWLALRAGVSAPAAPVAPAALACLALLAASPSFIFWQRQGIFVTNATLPFAFACIWQGLSWLRIGRGRNLALCALFAGLATYAKLLAAWIIFPFVLLCGCWYLVQRVVPPALAGAGRSVAPAGSPRLSLGLLLVCGAAFAIPLAPFVLFNLETGGTLLSVAQNLGSSYYGRDNAALAANAAVRWQQLAAALQGDHLWYLGAVHRNPLAAWLVLSLPLAGLLRPAGLRTAGPPLLLLLLAFGASLFTISDLFVTHYALLHPLAVAAGCAGLHALWSRSAEGGARAPGLSARLPAPGRGRSALRRLQEAGLLRCLPALLVCACLLLDLRATLAYHGALARSGGLVDHSDASYRLAYDLQYGGMGAPVVLDWGLEAPIRFLSQGTVTPVEIFGYGSLDAPDGAFGQRLGLFLDNPDNVYLLRAPGNELFQGRRAAFERLVEERGGRLQLEQVYRQRDGTPLYERWRVFYGDG